MNDERAVEVMGRKIRSGGIYESPEEWAREMLAALRAEGFDLYRPDECEVIEAEDVIMPGAAPAYRLVPVGGEG